MDKNFPTATHWSYYGVEVEDDRKLAVYADQQVPDPFQSRTWACRVMRAGVVFAIKARQSRRGRVTCPHVRRAYTTSPRLRYDLRLRVGDSPIHRS